MCKYKENDGLWSSAVGPWSVHLMFTVSWVLGLPLTMIGIATAVSHEAYVLATLIVLCATLQFYMPIKPWPAFVKFCHNAHPRNRFKSCFSVLPKSVSKEGSMFCFHPHGVLAVGFCQNGLLAPEMEQHNLTYLVATSVFFLPFFSLICYWLGTVRAANPGTLHELMKKRKNIALLPGGFQDATLASNTREKIFLKKRKGFVKYALRYGYKLHPVYTFGESDTFTTFDLCTSLRLWLNKFKIPTPIAFGDPLMPVLPRRTAGLLTVYGKPLQLPKIDDPKPEDVDKWHAQYLSSLVALYDEHKSSFSKQVSRHVGDLDVY